MIKSLRRKFIAISMASVFAVLGTIIAIINLTSYHKITEDAGHILNILSINGGKFPKEQPPHKNPKQSPNGLSPETPFESRYFTVRLTESGNVTAVDTGRIAAIETADAINYAQKIFETGTKSGFTDDYRYTRLNDNSGSLLIFLDCGRQLSTFRAFLATSLLVSAGGFLAVFILVIIFSKMVFRPVAESYEKQKRFITDASHELKTPLAVINANTEILEMENGENDWTRSIHNQVERLGNLTENLVSLSRMDEGDSTMQMIDFPLSDTVEEAAAPFEPLFKTSGLHLDTSIVRGLTCRGDEKYIRQLINILLDNALKYCTPSGTVTIALTKQGRNHVLTVSNPAENLPQGNLNILFERFYRADTSRSSSTGGYGIGLSVAKAIVQAHKGKISAYSPDGKSITITAVL